jgi:soluble lytic murein transglycosylase-like protein
MTPEWIQAIAAVLTLGAALAALRVAITSPERSARFAETYRSESKLADEQAALQRIVLASLMKCRAMILHQDALAAINLADVAFVNSKAVRDARNNFMSAAGEDPSQPVKIIERYHALIAAVVREMGLSDSITSTDIQGGYYPRMLGTLDDAAIADAEAKIAKRRTPTD